MGTRHQTMVFLLLRRNCSPERERERESERCTILEGNDIFRSETMSGKKLNNRCTKSNKRIADASVGIHVGFIACPLQSFYTQKPSRFYRLCPSNQETYEDAARREGGE